MPEVGDPQEVIQKNIANLLAILNSLMLEAQKAFESVRYLEHEAFRAYQAIREIRIKEEE